MKKFSVEEISLREAKLSIPKSVKAKSINRTTSFEVVEVQEKECGSVVTFELVDKVKGPLNLTLRFIGSYSFDYKITKKEIEEELADYARPFLFHSSSLTSVLTKEMGFLPLILPPILDEEVETEE